MELLKWSFKSVHSACYLSFTAKLNWLHLSREYVGSVLGVFWQTCFFGRDLFLFRALSCQVHMSLHMILRRHCYSHLDLSANPDNCDWIKRWKWLTALFFAPQLECLDLAKTFHGIKNPFSPYPLYFISGSPTFFDPCVFIRNLNSRLDNLGSPVTLNTADTVATVTVLLAVVVCWLIKCFFMFLHHVYSFIPT